MRRWGRLTEERVLILQKCEVRPGAGSPQEWADVDGSGLFRRELNTKGGL